MITATVPLCPLTWTPAPAAGHGSRPGPAGPVIIRKHACVLVASRWADSPALAAAASAGSRRLPVRVTDSSSLRTASSESSQNLLWQLEVLQLEAELAVASESDHATSTICLSMDSDNHQLYSSCTHQQNSEPWTWTSANLGNTGVVHLNQKFEIKSNNSHTWIMSTIVWL